MCNKHWIQMISGVQRKRNNTERNGWRSGVEIQILFLKKLANGLCVLLMWERWESQMILKDKKSRWAVEAKENCTSWDYGPVGFLWSLGSFSLQHSSLHWWSAGFARPPLTAYYKPRQGRLGPQLSRSP